MREAFLCDCSVTHSASATRKGAAILDARHNSSNGNALTLTRSTTMSVYQSGYKRQKCKNIETFISQLIFKIELGISYSEVSLDQ